VERFGDIVAAGSEPGEPEIDVSVLGHRFAERQQHGARRIVVLVLCQRVGEGEDVSRLATIQGGRATERVDRLGMTAAPCETRSALIPGRCVPSGHFAGARGDCAGQEKVGDCEQTPLNQLDKLAMNDLNRRLTRAG
jgi:hypothetical protein